LVRRILGISAFFHDSSAAIVVDGEIIAAVQEERFIRVKNTAVFPANSIKYCLDEAKLNINDVDGIIFFDKPFLKFERILETHYKNAPNGWLSFIKSMPSWSDKKLFLRRTLKKELKASFSDFDKKTMIHFSSHHYSHAASAFFPSPFEESAVLVCDAVGEWATTSILMGKKGKIKPLQEMHFPDSVGLLYSSFTYFLGFKVMEGEYKLMGLSPYGDKHSAQTQNYIQKTLDHLVCVNSDGSISINQDYFTYEVGLRMISDQKWERLFNIKKRTKDEPIRQEHCNLALAIQLVTEDILLRMAKTAKEITESENLCLAGGVALNCVVNGKLQEKNIFKNIWVQPAAGDAGGALGAALGLYYSKNERTYHDEKMKKAFLGPNNTKEETLDFIASTDEKTISFESEEERNVFIVNQLKEGKIIGWVQGRLEFGPRALGGRSILALPSIANMQNQLNLAVKFREDFRPFAPVMLKKEASKYFDCDHSARYMQFVHKLKPEFRIQRPENYSKLSLKEKLRSPRSKFQAITHVNYSSRIQIVDEEDHPLYSLLSKVREVTGDGILVNTSFNRSGEPIVNTIKEAYDCFINTKISTLVLGNHVILK